MRRCRLTKPTRLIAGLLAGLLFAILAVPLIAQPTRETHQFYDITKEVTLKGTVASVITRASQGMIMGSHLMLETGSGRVDASLGKWGMAGKGALSVSAGEGVEVTGVMKTLKDKNEVFVVRTVRANGHLYTIRNAHGIPVSPQSRERASQSQKTTQKGESL
jgi:DNA/RNA endonuclease YhcR with UshA esterase domain